MAGLIPPGRNGVSIGGRRRIRFDDASCADVNVVVSVVVQTTPLESSLKLFAEGEAKNRKWRHVESRLARDVRYYDYYDSWRNSDIYLILTSLSSRDSCWQIIEASLINNDLVVVSRARSFRRSLSLGWAGGASGDCGVARRSGAGARNLGCRRARMVKKKVNNHGHEGERFVRVHSHSSPSRTNVGGHVRKKKAADTVGTERSD